MEVLVDLNNIDKIFLEILRKPTMVRVERLKFMVIIYC